MALKKFNREQVAAFKWWQEFKEEENKGSLSAKFFRLEIERRFPFITEHLKPDVDIQNHADKKNNVL